MINVFVNEAIEILRFKPDTTEVDLLQTIAEVEPVLSPCNLRAVAAEALRQWPDVKLRDEAAKKQERCHAAIMAASNIVKELGGKELSGMREEEIAKLLTRHDPTLDPIELLAAAREALRIVWTSVE
jgi:hypothetical protein